MNDAKTSQPDKEKSKTEGENWIQHFFKASGYSTAGIKAGWTCEMAFRMECVAAVLLTPIALFIPVPLIFKAIVISSMLLVLVTELLNSAIEWTIDYISTERHPLGKRVKDMGSAAVFFALVNSGVMWAAALIEWSGILT
ncbi:MAG: diacylglycerol kinase [Puniceicoccaceae bacterium]